MPTLEEPDPTPGGEEEPAQPPTREEVAAGQHGVLSRAQATSSGLSRFAIAYRVRTGRWEVVLPGVYRIAGAPASWHQSLMVAVLWCGAEAAISHQTAACLFGLDGFSGAAKDPVHVSTTANRKAPPASIVCHRVAALPAAQVHRIGGVPVTSPDRLLIDLAPKLTVDKLERALDEVLRQGLASRFRIAWMLGKSRTPGRQALARLLAPRLPGYIPPDSELEALFFKLLEGRGLPLPKRQVPIEGTDFRVDYQWEDFPVAAEMQGFRWHSSRHAWQRDLEKRNLLTARGIYVFQLTWKDVAEDPQPMLDSVSSVLDRFRASAGGPLAQGGPGA